MSCSFGDPDEDRSQELTRGLGRSRGAAARCSRTGFIVLVSILLSACVIGASPDLGSSPDQQLCNILRSALRDDGRLESDLEVQLEAAAEDPDEVTGDLAAIALGYATWQSSYDQLGPYEPAIRFSTRFVELEVEDLIGPGELADKVVRSAQAIDSALEAGICRTN